MMFDWTDSCHVLLICLWKSVLPVHLQGSSEQVERRALLSGSTCWKVHTQSQLKWFWFRLRDVHSCPSVSCFQVLLYSRIVITHQPGQATEEALTTEQVHQFNDDILFVHSASDAWKSGQEGGQENPHSEGEGLFWLAVMLINVSGMLLLSMITTYIYQRLWDMYNLLITSLNGDMLKGGCSHLLGVHGLFLRLLCIFLRFIWTISLT